MVAGSDQAVTQKALTALVDSHRYELQNLQVENSKDGLIITGQVSSFFAKQQAQEAIRAAIADIQVINHVEVV